MAFLNAPQEAGYNSDMRITIPDAKKPFVEKQMAKRGYEDVAEYLMSLLEREERRDLRAELEKELLEGLDSTLLPWTPELRDRIQRLGRRAAKRKPR